MFVVLGTNHYMDAEEAREVAGFSTPASAQENAGRFIRAPVEQRRHASATDTIRHFDGYAGTEGLDSAACVAFCAKHPATRPDRTDYAALEPNRTLP